MTSSSGVVVSSALDVSRKFGQKPRELTSKEEFENEGVDRDSKQFRMFLKRREEWQTKHNGGINEVEALKNIFYSFLFAQKQAVSSTHRNSVKLETNMCTLNPFYKVEFERPLKIIEKKSIPSSS
jgi:hypothetical protein